jgi:diguanylate cyclase (GGDEF)-like protein
MALHPAGWRLWVNDGQLLVAGVALMFALDQIAVWRWEGRRSSARSLVLGAVIVAAVLIDNAVLGLSFGHHDMNALVVTRAALGAALAISILPLGSAICGRRPPLWVTVPIVAIGVIRQGLLVDTHLVYRYTLGPAGVPAYGPLESLSAFIAIGLVFTYLGILTVREKDDRERAVLALGVAGSAVLAIASFIGTGFWDEVLAGYLTVPMLLAMAVLIWMRQDHARREVVQFASRQRALAELGQVAIEAPLADVEASANGTLASHLSNRPAASRTAQDQEFIGAVRNIVASATERSRVADDLEYQATHDDLTGLANRRYIGRLLTVALADPDHTGGRSVAVALCNLDRFKTFNDAYGHDAGDAILTAVGRRLTATTQACDRIGRFGSDEFVVICDDAGANHPIDTLVEQIHGAFRVPISTGMVDAHVSTTVGLSVTHLRAGAPDPDLALREAMMALHDAKARNIPTRLFSHELRAGVEHRARVERLLTGAVQRGEIAVQYQPIVDLETWTVVAFEALARWRQGGGHLAPGEWIPVAEETGLIGEIGRHLLLTAANEAGLWHAAGHPVRINVNVSGRQLDDPMFEHAVEEALELVPAGSLCLELTESLALADGADATIKKLSARGTEIALDDFGTGYSALAVIAQLPIDQIKIDRSITAHIDERDGTALVGATMAIARSLDLAVVAEGVETRRQHDALVALGCTRAQGFLYSRPLEADAALDLLAAGGRIGEHDERTRPGPLRRLRTEEPA